MASQDPSKISLTQTLSTITKVYNPKLVAMVNKAIEFRVAKIKGDFIWHAHATTDELFLILSGGPLVMRLRRTPDDETSEYSVELGEGDLFVVPKGVQHFPSAENEARVLMAESAGELNTGDQGVGERTVVVEDVR